MTETLSLVNNYFVLLVIFFLDKWWNKLEPLMLTVWMFSVSGKERNNLSGDFVCKFIAGFCFLLWQQMVHQAVSSLHPNPSSLQSPHQPVQGASVSTRYYVSYTLLNLVLFVPGHIKKWLNSGSHCWLNWQRIALSLRIFVTPNIVIRCLF